MEIRLQKPGGRHRSRKEHKQAPPWINASPHQGKDQCRSDDKRDPAEVSSTRNLFSPYIAYTWNIFLRAIGVMKPGIRGSSVYSERSLATFNLLAQFIKSLKNASTRSPRMPSLNGLKSSGFTGTFSFLTAKYTSVGIWMALVSAPCGVRSRPAVIVQSPAHPQHFHN